MSYIKAEKVLPKELIEDIQQYVSGKSIYIPCKEKQDWGSRTKTKEYYELRNTEIVAKYREGANIKLLADTYFLSEKSIQRIVRNATEKDMEGKEMEQTIKYTALREVPALKEKAADWFHSKWGVPTEAYLECIEAYLSGETELGWYLCLDGEKIVAGLGVIENDFHDRKDLAPNVCAVYTEEEYRCRRIAGTLLDLAVEDLRKKGITPVYLITNHDGFYEKYGWEFFCMVQGDGEEEKSKMYIHK